MIQNRFKEEEFLTIVKKSIKYQHNKRRKEEKDLLESDHLSPVGRGGNEPMSGTDGGTPAVVNLSLSFLCPGASIVSRAF